MNFSGVVLKDGVRYCKEYTLHRTTTYMDFMKAIGKEKAIADNRVFVTKTLRLKPSMVNTDNCEFYFYGEAKTEANIKALEMEDQLEFIKRALDDECALAHAYMFSQEANGKKTFYFTSRNEVVCNNYLEKFLSLTNNNKSAISTTLKDDFDTLARDGKIAIGLDFHPDLSPVLKVYVVLELSDLKEKQRYYNIAKEHLNTIRDKEFSLKINNLFSVVFAFKEDDLARLSLYYVA